MKLSRSLVILCRVLALILVATGVTLARSSSVSSAPAKASTAAAKRASGIMWYQAKRYAGLTRAVKGPVRGTKYASSTSGRPTFINIGRNHPNPSRFKAVIWSRLRAAFPSSPEAMYRGKTVLATRTIRMHQGSAQMFIRSPSKLRIVR